MNLVDRIQQHSEQIVTEAVGALGQARLHHYEESGEDATRARVGDLLAAVLDSLRLASPLRIVEHSDQVARQRYLAGFGIDEIQVAFNALEEALWRLLVRDVPADQLVEELGAIGSVLGAGKDQLGRTYVALASEHHRPSIDVEQLNKGV